MSKPALGKGLGALIKPNNTNLSPSPVANPQPIVEKGERVEQIDCAAITPNRFQPRRVFNEDIIQELADTIKIHGLLQPIVVRKNGDKFELISGERRWRATKKLELTQIRAIVRVATDAELAELAIIENIHREDLNPIEQAHSFQKLISTFNLRQEDIAIRLGISRTSVTNILRLLSLPEEVQAWVNNGQLSAGHAKAILGLDSPEEQKTAAERVLKDGLNVRATERLINDLKNMGSNAGAIKSKKGGGSVITKSESPEIKLVQETLRQKLGTKVHIQHHPKKGCINIEYYGDADLNRILDLLHVEI